MCGTNIEFEESASEKFTSANVSTTGILKKGFLIENFKDEDREPESTDYLHVSLTIN